MTISRNVPCAPGSDPAVAAFAVTPSDTVDFTQGPCRALYVGVTGDITAVVLGNAVLFKAAPVGILPIQCSRVNATATTATSIVALY